VSPKHFDGKPVLAACGGSQHSVALVFNGECLSTSDESIPAWVTALREGILSSFVYSNYMEQKNVLKKTLVKHETIGPENQIKQEGSLLLKEHDYREKNDDYVPQRVTRASLRKKQVNEEGIAPKEVYEVLKKKSNTKVVKVRKEEKVNPTSITQNKIKPVNKKPVKRAAAVKKKTQPINEVQKKVATKTENPKETFLTEELQQVRKQPSRSSKKRQVENVTKESVKKNAVATTKPTLSSSSSVQQKKATTLSKAKLVDMEPTRKLPPRKARR
jgi:hypothetical protein